MKPLFDLSTLRNAAVRLVQRSSSFCLSRLWAVFADRGGMAGDDRHNPRRARPQSLPRDSMTPKGRKNGTITSRPVLTSVYGAERPRDVHPLVAPKLSKSAKRRALVGGALRSYHGSHCQRAAAVRTDGAQAGHPRA